jgi:MarR family transcriptional regulator, organic hydroperoxide resistance regulator
MKPVKQHISEEKLQHFMEVAEIINELIADKKIYNK